MEFTRVEWIEFSSAEEFKKFREMPPITEAEIQHVHIGDLVERLQDAHPSTNRPDTDQDA
jgi:hypothetical protein